VEMGQLVAGPFCGQLFGDLGADVIKIEPPGAGDPMRQWGREKPHGKSLWWPVVARNKRSVTLDLRVPAGQELARAVIGTADILIENFRPGTLERWDLAPDRLWQDRPGLIVVRVTGFGQTGPYSSHAGFGSIGEAMGGIRYVTGDADRPPARTGISLGDSLAGMHGVMGALAALRERDRTGRGQVVDVAIYEAVLAMMESLVTEWDAAGYQRERSGAILPNVAPSNAYPTADGGSVLIAANHDAVFARLCAEMGQGDLAADPRYATHGARGANQAELDDLIAAWSSQLTAGELIARLRGANVPAGLIYRARDMMADPHVAAREAIIRVPDQVFGDLAMQGVFPRLTATPGSVRWTGPALGEHNDQVFRDELGIPPGRLQDLRDQGVL
jgi:formyl-CoA transferase